MTDSTPDIRMDALIHSFLGNPVDAMAKQLTDDGPQDQTREPTPEELRELKQLAIAASNLQDQIRDALGKKQEHFKRLKDELLDRLQQFGMRELKIPGRPAIERVARNSKQKTKKAITETLTSMRGPEEGPAIAKELWNSLPNKEYDSLVIPEVAPPELDSPY